MVGELLHAIGSDYGCVGEVLHHSRNTAWNRRLRLVVGSVAASALLVAFCSLLATNSESGEDLNQGLDTVLVEADDSDTAKRRAVLAAQDAAFCATRKGWLTADCLKSRAVEREDPDAWTENQVREGLWKTEKALADLELREYGHGQKQTVEQPKQVQNQPRSLGNFLEQSTLKSSLQLKAPPTHLTLSNCFSPPSAN